MIPLIYFRHHNKSAEELQNINERFVEIQKAYEKLSSIKNRRSKKNKAVPDEQNFY